MPGLAHLLPDRSDKPTQRRKRYTGFGKTLRKLVEDRDIRSWTLQEERVHETIGRSYSHQSMSKYAAGTVEIPSEVVMSFAETLSHSRTERRDLAEQHTYHSRPEDL